MFVYNIKINGMKTFKTIFIIILILLLFIMGSVMWRFVNASKEKTNTVCDIKASNYTNVLKATHENIDNYIGVKIHFTGYVYRVLDLKDNQFVLARDMIISSNYQAVVVGFLCEYDKAKNFNNDTWVEITGEIIKGDYHGDMPIIKITNIQETNKPSEEYVYPPDESYIPTEGML